MVSTTRPVPASAGQWASDDWANGMNFWPTTLPGAWRITLSEVTDERGFFARTVCTETMRARSLEGNFIQHSISFSHRQGTLRGMHFQTAPHAEVKLVRCLRGAIYDVLLDLRPQSPTFRRWEAFELTADNRHQLYVPKGFAHGFQSLADNAEVSYLISEPYELTAAGGVRYDDPAFGIVWPLPVSALSEKDRTWPDFKPG